MLKRLKSSPPKHTTNCLSFTHENTMHAQIPKRWVTHFMSRLTEDSEYYIKYFQVCNARPNYWPVDYPYMAQFTTHTQIHQVKTVPAHFPQ